MLGKLQKIAWLIFFLVWPWQTRYFLFLGVNEYLTRSIYVSDLLAIFLILLMIIGKNGEIKAKEILRYFFIGLVPVALLAIIQFGLQTTWSTKWLGLAKHDPAELGQVVTETVNGERWLRAYGSFDHPNILGGVMALALLLLLLNKRGKWCWLENVCTALFTGALFISFSRTAWLGLIVGLAVYLLINFYKKLPINKEFFVVLILIFTTLTFIYSNLVFARTLATGRIEQKSINERVVYYGEAKELFLLHPYFGLGFHNYVPSLMNLNPGRPNWSYQPVHNVFVLAVVELGIVGVIIWSAILWLGFKLINKAKKININVAVILSLLVVLAMFDHWLWSLHAGLMLIGLLVAIGVKLIKENN